jgi:sortase A
MMKKVAVALIAAGFFCISYSIWNIMESRQEQLSTLSQAKEMIRHSKIKQLSSETKQVSSITKQVMTEPHGVEGSQKESILGILKVPRLHKELPIVEGTNENMLKRGVGHFAGSGFPGQHNQIVLSGHRDTVFRHFGELKKGDEVIVSLQTGRFLYVIDHMKIVKADDRTVIHSTKPKEELVLTTCYPFYYIGDAPDRYIIYAYPK